MSLSGILLFGLPLTPFAGLSLAPVAEAPIAAEATAPATGLLISKPMPQTLEQIIDQQAEVFGVDQALAKSIAFCESTNRHFDKTGGVLRGEKNRFDVGLFQINEIFHLEKSRELGFDIYTPQGNIAYALWLLKNEGTRHWSWSRPCWQSQRVS